MDRIIITPVWRPLNLTTSILPVEARRLKELARGKTVLEVGAAHGYSAVIMALAGAVHVTSIDSHNGDTQLGDTWTSMQNNLDAFGVTDKVTMIKGMSGTVLPELVKEGKKFDFIFLDGSANIDENLVDIELSKQLLAPGGVVARHDYGHPDYQFKAMLDNLFPQGPARLTNSLFEFP